MPKFLKYLLFMIFALSLAACSSDQTTDTPVDNSSPAGESAVSPTAASADQTIAEPTLTPESTAAEPATATAEPDEGSETLPGDAGYPAPETPGGYPAPEDEGEAGYPAPEEPEGYPAPPSDGAESGLPLEMDGLTFPSEDGLNLVGTYYPPKSENAPLVILFHQAGGSRTDWEDLARWMQNRPDEIGYAAGAKLARIAGQYTFFPVMPEDLSFAVFAVDFRNHGESGTNDAGFDRAGFLMDARAALAYASQLEGADPSRIILMGASIGADASVDTCLVLDGTEIAEEQQDRNCIGIMAFSPGSYLGVSYKDAVQRLAEGPFRVRTVHCIAAENDNPSAGVCQDDINSLHAQTIYPGGAHGLAMIEPDLDPNIGQVILDFLLTSLGE